MLGIILGNAASLLATLVDSFSATRKTTKSMLLTQLLSKVIYVAASLALKGYSGTVQNVVGIISSLCAIFGKTFRGADWFFVGLAVVFGLYFNNRGLVGLLPILANVEYTFCMFRFKDNERAMKAAFIAMNLLFMVYDSFLYNYVGAVSCLVVVISAVVSLLTTRKGKEAKAE